MVVIKHIEHVEHIGCHDAKLAGRVAHLETVVDFLLEKEEAVEDELHEHEVEDAAEHAALADEIDELDE